MSSIFVNSGGNTNDYPTIGITSLDGNCQTLHQPFAPSLDVFKYLNVLPKLRGPELDTALKVWPDQCPVQGKNDLPAPAGHAIPAIPDPGQDAIGPLGHQGTFLAHAQSAVNQYPQVPFCLGTVQPLCAWPMVLHRVAVTKAQELPHGLTNPHIVGFGQSIQPVQVPLQSLPALQDLVPSANLLMEHLIPSSRSSIKILNRMGPNTDPW
ncbi:hypothetical protein HGM15179_007313 [Zosterops borbonicus]|uniref:Uncharacterized protein n=1 Tax=Zosterops borbonicus TaxID=364589 RepID=A0A8K1GLR4_9PASS|nr:hypothetical protein HGM15179_007313 [Zosterops borbonicus]